MGRIVKNLCVSNGLCCWFSQYGMSQEIYGMGLKFGMHLKFYVGQNVDVEIWNLPHRRNMGENFLEPSGVGHKF